MLRRRLPISVLDLAPVPDGATSGEALRRSTDLVRLAEGLGYHRYWVAEHHNMPGIASSSPAVLLAHLGAASKRIRLGSGGVMLPNHAPLVIAEQFGMLEALHPGRIDLGLGRAPGSDQVTAAALRRNAAGSSGDDFPDQLGQLIAFFQGSFPSEHPFHRIRALPPGPEMPDIWLLGSSGFGAQLAGMLGLPFAFAHHFSPANTLPALELYRSHFRPSARLEEPYAMVGVAAVVADTDERARWLHGSMQLSMLRLRTGHPGLLPSPDEAATYGFTPNEKHVVEQATGSHVVGSPETVTGLLDQLIEGTGADEIMVTTNVYDHDARLHSYELVADIAGLADTAPGAAADSEPAPAAR
jgi:luciferase family oxidoreductase group 1